MDAYLATLGNKATRSNTLYGLRRWLAWCERAEILPEAASTQAIQMWIGEELASGRHRRTLYSEASCVRGWYRWMRRVGMARADPSVGVRLPRRPPPTPRLWLGPRDLRLLLRQACTDSYPGACAAIHLWAICGTRIGETLALDVTDASRIDDELVLRITRGKDTGVDWLHCPPLVARQVHRARGGRMSGPLLVGLAGRRLLDVTARAELRRLCAAAGVPEVTPHGLRTGQISLALGAHVPPRDVQYGAGHRHMSSTESYDRGRIAAAGDAAEAVARLVIG